MADFHRYLGNGEWAIDIAALAAAAGIGCYRPSLRARLLRSTGLLSPVIA